MEDDNQNTPSASSPAFPQAETPSQEQGHSQSPLMPPSTPLYKGADTSVFKGEVELKRGMRSDG